MRTRSKRDSVLTTQGIDLLSGLYDIEIHSPTTSIDQWRVAEANEILTELFRIACSSLSEPSFNVNDWTAVKSLYRLVVERRLELTGLLQFRHSIPEETLYDKVWKDTIVTLVELERSACKSEHERLQFHSADGPLAQHIQFRGPTAKPTTYSGASYRFLDTFARARDELWKTIRSLSYPAVVSLQPPWSRGLPIQCLNVPFGVAGSEAKNFTPYLRSRAAEVVFLDQKPAKASIPPDEESRVTIGTFVDSYDVALQIHVMQQPGEQLKAIEISRAWKHATAMAQGRMDECETIRYWCSRFKGALPSVKLNLPVIDRECEEYPLLPTTSDSSETLEWDPTSNQPSKTETRSLSATTIDCFLAQPAAVVDLSRPFQQPRPATLSFTPRRVWRIHDPRKISGG